MACCRSNFLRIFVAWWLFSASSSTRNLTSLGLGVRILHNIMNVLLFAGTWHRIQLRSEIPRVELSVIFLPHTHVLRGLLFVSLCFLWFWIHLYFNKLFIGKFSSHHIYCSVTRVLSDFFFSFSLVFSFSFSLVFSFPLLFSWTFNLSFPLLFYLLSNPPPTHFILSPFYQMPSFTKFFFLYLPRPCCFPFYHSPS